MTLTAMLENLGANEPTKFHSFEQHHYFSHPYLVSIYLLVSVRTSLKASFLLKTKYTTGAKQITYIIFKFTFQMIYHAVRQKYIYNKV